MIYLIGSFMVNNNYGDVIQADFWVRWYHTAGIKIKYVCFKEGTKKCLRSLQLEKDELMTVDNFIKLKRVSQVNFVHFYGGGYMNERWGQVFADIAKHAVGLGMKVFATGVQVDKEFIEMTTSLQINYLSVRDRISQQLTGNNAIIADDSFGYFLINRKRFDLFYFKDIFIKKNVILIQFSLNKYVYEGINNNAIINAYRNFVLQMRTRYKVELCSSFPNDIPGIVENENLIKTLSLDSKIFKYITTEDLDKNPKCSYKMIIVNSFHTYILALHKFACPVYFIAFSNYYKQKAEALKNYKLLDNLHLINNPVDLYNILNSKIKSEKISRINIWKAQNSFLKVVENVKDYLK